MTTPRLGVGVASAGSYLYAVGGSDGDGPLASTERWVLFCTIPSVIKAHVFIDVVDTILLGMSGAWCVQCLYLASTWELLCWMACCMQ